MAWHQKVWFLSEGTYLYGSVNYTRWPYNERFIVSFFLFLFASFVFLISQHIWSSLHGTQNVIKCATQQKFFHASRFWFPWVTLNICRLNLPRTSHVIGQFSQICVLSSFGYFVQYFLIKMDCSLVFFRKFGPDLVIV